MFLEHQNNVLELFLKDHVTMKTGVMSAENSALPSQNKMENILKQKTQFY